MSSRAHWQEVYRATATREVSWYREHLDRSLELIGSTGAPRDARVIDVGGGASTLVDDLLALGFDNLTVLDISDEALDAARTRLGDAADRVAWLQADITSVDLGKDSFDLWHDRATLHFLTDAEDRRRYADTLTRALAPGGHAILAEFSREGPPQCSGLDVHRYGVEEIEELLGADFELRDTLEEEHTTPAGNPQRFAYFWLQRSGNPEVVVPDDFNAALPDDILDLFEGKVDGQDPE